VEYEIRWGGDPEDICVVCSGPATVEELDAWVQEVIGDPRFRPELRVLVDHRRADWTGLSSDDLRRRADLLARDAERIGRQRVAWVTGRPIEMGLGRMLQAFTDTRTQLTGHYFDDIDEARAWLRGDDD
jgi:hypothetical protein